MSNNLNTKDLEEIDKIIDNALDLCDTVEDEATCRKVIYLSALTFIEQVIIGKPVDEYNELDHQLVKKIKEYGKNLLLPDYE